ncbi:flagellar transcriptional regulator FlhD [Variovorax sp.]|uniref:flagellar transcriptional regulator FlhD n=1 Tax=Variovorax sp. TaxID=1871043 RepID=UPI0039C9310A
METEFDRDGNEGGVEISKEIGDLNLAYMLLAQKLVKMDRGAAMYRLGISRELADLLANMSLAQIMKLAASNFLLCSFRLHDHPVFSVFGEEKESLLQQAHMSILMAARQLQVRESGEMQ